MSIDTAAPVADSVAALASSTPAVPFDIVANVETAPTGKPARRNGKPMINPDQPPATLAPVADLVAVPPADHTGSIPAGVNEALARDALAETKAAQDNGTAPTEQPATMTPEEYVSFHLTAVGKIVDKICTQFADASARNIEIGKDAYNLALKEKEITKRYTAEDFDAMVQTIRTRVRLRLPIKPESIKIVEWAKVYLLRELARPIMGDDIAETISVTEGIHLTPDAMTFEKTTLTAALKPRWVDFLRHLAAERRADFAATNGSKFEQMIEDHRKKLAAEDLVAANASKTPEQLAQEAESATRKKANDKAKRANTAVTTAVSTALKDGTMTPAQIAACVESAAQDTGKPLAAFLGVNPATITEAEISIFVETMVRAGKYKEMQILRNRLSKVLDRLAAQKAARESALNVACTSMQPAESAA